MHAKVTPRLGRPGVDAVCDVRCRAKSQFETTVEIIRVHTSAKTRQSHTCLPSSYNSFSKVLYRPVTVSAPEFDGFFPGTCPNPPPNLVQIRSVLFTY